VAIPTSPRKAPFLFGVFLITFALLIFQSVQTRILSVMAWYYMAFFAISVAMLGMTAGAVWVYLRRDRLASIPLSVTLTNFSLATAVSIPASIILQFCLVTGTTPTLSTVFAWSLLLIAMAIPYVFSGIVVSLALTRSPFPTGQVYGVDLLGAALGCLAVIFLLNLVDGPTAALITGLVCGLAAMVFSRSASLDDQKHLQSLPRWRRPGPVTVAITLLACFNAFAPKIGLRPILVKDYVEQPFRYAFETWNSYSRIVATSPQASTAFLWGPSTKLPRTPVMQSTLNIDGNAGTSMFHYDGTPQSISFLQYDLVGLAYRLPNIHKSAVIGVGGGRDIMTAHYFGVADITGVELNPIFIYLDTRQPYFRDFGNLQAIPNVKLHVDDARSWFASTHEKFDLVQMSMIDTWAATGAGAFSLSENGLYTLEGWRAFLHTINDDGIFTVSRWYSPDDVNETGRMIGLATAALLESGVPDARPHLYVASAESIATLVLSKKPFTPEQLQILNDTVHSLGFRVLLAPGQPPESPLLRAITESTTIDQINNAVKDSRLNLSVTTDNQPFFFNQLRFLDIPKEATYALKHSSTGGVLHGNLIASAVLALILFISIVAVFLTVIVPLRSVVLECPRPLVITGTLYFSAIGMGFMLAEIALLQRFSVFLGHPIYSLSVCLFSLILASGLGSLASDRFRLSSPARLATWGSLVALYLLLMNYFLPIIFERTTGDELLIRIAVSIAVIMPLGFLLGFAFPTGMRLVEAIDPLPTPWFWGINGATGVLASVLGVMISMGLGINITLLISALCYVLLIPISFSLIKMKQKAPVTSDLRQPV
jgi:spermidine synthase